MSSKKLLPTITLVLIMALAAPLLIAPAQAADHPCHPAVCQKRPEGIWFVAQTSVQFIQHARRGECGGDDGLLEQAEREST